MARSSCTDDHEIHGRAAASAMPHTAATSGIQCHLRFGSDDVGRFRGDEIEQGAQSLPAHTGQQIGRDVISQRAEAVGREAKQADESWELSP